MIIEMKITKDKHKKVSWINKTLSVGMLFLMTSCGFYSATYVATYTLKDTKNREDTEEILINYVNNLPEKNYLSKDSKFDGTDTLAFYGKPYHYFKFWLEQKDNNSVFKLDYWGMYGSRKRIPYRNLFDELNEFLNTNFTVLEQDIKDVNNAKDKK